MLSLVAGLAGGAIHALSGPDHLAAVAPLSLGNRRSGLLAGLDWGMGHGAGVILIGGLALLARDTLSIHLVSGWSEFGVGFLLLALGAWAGWKGYQAWRSRGAELHSHQHRKRGATFGVGALHGSAGASHLIGILPATGLSTVGAASYLLAYFLGATLAMMLIGSVAGELAQRGGWKLRPLLMFAAAAVACVVGVGWIVSSWPA
ncbi:MAG: High-affinity nickel transporter [Polyangiaceae bacterium]